MGLRKLFGLCEHEWSKWEYSKENWGPAQRDVGIKTCSKCGLKKKKYLN